MLMHERWFTSGAFPVRFEEIRSAQTWVPLAIALGVTGAAMVLWRIRDRRDIVPGPIELGVTRENYLRLMSFMPLIIGVHTAVLLLVSGVELQLFVPNLVLPWHFIGGAIALAEIVVAISFLYGALARFGAAVLGALWLAGALLFGPLLLLEHALFLGIAFFMFVNGRGPLAIDMTVEHFHRPVERAMPYAVPALRVLTGVAICVLAFTEKLWNLDMGLAFLERYPFNFLPALGFSGVTDRDFLLIAGAVELTIGLLLISGAFLRLTILLLWLPFNLTIPFLGWRELVGHLPIYGIMALLLVWGGTRPETQRKALLRQRVSARDA